MRFRPLTKKYSHSAALAPGIPGYMARPVLLWVLEVLHETDHFHDAEFSSPASISRELGARLNVLFRETFPVEWQDFQRFLLADSERLLNFLSFCLQNFAYPNHAASLERILADGGSEWAVMETEPGVTRRGNFELTARVPDAVKDAAEPALQASSLLREAWLACYSRNPDYEKTVSKATDALETLYKTKYFPTDTKPNLAKFLNDFAQNPGQLRFKGDSLVIPKNQLAELSRAFVPIRGHHTSGTGRSPTKEEAEFVLHYAIFIWNISR